jgi:hypothetical protein
MARPENVMQVFRLLDKSNCRKCGEKTCLAFAGAVFQQRRIITECPTIDRSLAEPFLPEQSDGSIDNSEDDFLDILKGRIGECDLRLAARRTGGMFDGQKLIIKILGKDFSVDREGNLYSDIHIIPWVAIPFLVYVLESSGNKPAGDWVSFRELKGAQERYPLFRKRCEKGMQRIADVYTDLFDDLVHLFDAQQVESRFNADISVILPVLPLVPLMICYWRPNEGIGSSLNLFFDRSIDANLGNEVAFTLGAGLTQMFEKLAVRHGFPVEPIRC